MSSPFQEEYLPTSFRDSVGREYAIHITVRSASEICRLHSLSLQDLASGPALPFHVLLDVAEIGTRYQSRAKDQSRDEFIDALGDESTWDAVIAAGNALTNFFLRSQRTPPDQARAIADRHAGNLALAKDQIAMAIAELAGNGAMSGESEA